MTEYKDAIVDRTHEFSEEDPEVKVTLPDGYTERFFVQNLCDAEYIRRTIMLREIAPNEAD